MRLIAIRHGETEWNVAKREQGHLDSPLTARGVEQAKALAKRLCRQPLDALYSSDLGRALQTADIIASATGLPVLIDAALRERHMGIFQGLTRLEMARRFPVEYAEYRRIGHTYRIPQGESGQDRLERTLRAFTEIAERHPEGTVAAVTHGGILMGIFEHVLGIPPGNSWRFRRLNAAYNRFDYTDGRWSLETWNDTAHLDEIGSLEDTTVQKLVE